MRITCALVLLNALTAACQAQNPAELRNWFNDPFFQISAALPGCPMPLGPLITEAERRAEAHHRGERGTACWLAGKCERPNYYEYDQDIAAAFRSAAAGKPDLFANTSLWITVQGRVVFIEGCVSTAAAAPKLELFARQLPHVQLAFAIVRTDASAAPPYKVRPGE